ncbi:hypothetical protein ADUPG1_000648 [Aduncisulcus paluster]|uniref:Uncharacterized protein n=1 Tax=Aduncisulcus paluster TaxID=2918883 RepID=A0ABQ5KC23_9EUKA|nr:hypothetical protein ADUPG1_000648 [Aduncisulcus paluster]
MSRHTIVPCRLGTKWLLQVVLSFIFAFALYLSCLLYKSTFLLPMGSEKDMSTSLSSSTKVTTPDSSSASAPSAPSVEFTYDEICAAFNLVKRDWADVISDYDKEI